MVDRAEQRKLLERMRDAHPFGISFEPPGDEISKMNLLSTLVYLEEHGLCRGGAHVGNNTSYAFTASKITAAGIDFLADDGGLSAILGVVTVKLHADTIRDLMAAKIDESNLPVEEKSALKRHLAGLSETALKVAATDLVKLGLDHLPDAIHWLRTLHGL